MQPAAEQPWVTDGANWRIWQGAYSPQAPRTARAPWQRDAGRAQKQPDFPGYTTVSVRTDMPDSARAAADGTDLVGVDGAPRDQLVPTTQSALNFARKAETRVLKLHALKRERAEQWTLYEKKLKEAFQRERSRSAKDLEAIGREITEAERAQEEARAMLRTVVAESLGARASVDVPMEVSGVDAVFAEWAEEDHATLHGVLQRALTPAFATPPRTSAVPPRTPHTAMTTSAIPPAVPGPGSHYAQGGLVPGLPPQGTAMAFPGLVHPASPAPVATDPYQAGTPIPAASARTTPAPGGPTIGEPPGLVAVELPAAPPEGEPRSYGPSPTAAERLQRRRAMHPFGRVEGNPVPAAAAPDMPENPGHSPAVPGGIRIVEDDGDELDDAGDGHTLS